MWISFVPSRYTRSSRSSGLNKEANAERRRSILFLFYFILGRIFRSGVTQLCGITRIEGNNKEKKKSGIGAPRTGAPRTDRWTAVKIRKFDSEILLLVENRRKMIYISHHHPIVGLFRGVIRAERVGLRKRQKGVIIDPLIFYFSIWLGGCLKLVNKYTRRSREVIFLCSVLKKL